MKNKRRPPQETMMTNIDCLIMLHHEAADHLQMMHDLLASNECLEGSDRKEIGCMLMNHWNEYMDIMHMISTHDQIMANAMDHYEMDMRKESKPIPEDAERQFGFFRFPLFPLLLFGLIFRHRRRRNFFESHFRRDQFVNYLSSTSHLECDHIARLTCMLNDMV
jgi:hypothetical protein